MEAKKETERLRLGANGIEGEAEAFSFPLDPQIMTSLDEELPENKPNITIPLEE